MQRRDLLAAALILGSIPYAFGGDLMLEGTTRTVVRDGVELATEAFGAPLKGTILLAMGATASMVWWPDAMIEALATAGYQVIRFDHRDTGRSTTGAPGDVRYDINDLAGDLVAILDAHGVKSAHFVGMSLGGYLSQIVALRHPRRVLSLTLIASEPIGIAYEGEGIAPEFMEHMGTLGELDWSSRDAVAEFMLTIAELSAGSARPFDRHAAMARVERELQRTGSMRSAFNHVMLGGELEPSMTAAALRQPLLLIHGSEDPIISPAGARAAHEVVAGARLLVLEAVGHELVAGDMPRIVEAILANCARTS